MAAARSVFVEAELAFAQAAVAQTRPPLEVAWTRVATGAVAVGLGADLDLWFAGDDPDRYDLYRSSGPTSEGKRSVEPSAAVAPVSVPEGPIARLRLSF